jgi:hypothetical protein
MSQENIYQQMQERLPQLADLQQADLQQRMPQYPQHGYHPGHPHMTYHHVHHHYHYHQPVHHYPGR